MAWSQVQEVGATETGGNGSLSATIAANSIGNLLVACVQVGTTAITSSSVTNGGTWAKATSVLSSTWEGSIWYAIATASTTTITLNLSGKGVAVMSVMEFSGERPYTDVLDQKQSGSGNSTSPTSGSSPAQTNVADLAVAMIGAHDSLGVIPTLTITTSGYTSNTQHNSILAGGNSSGVISAYQALPDATATSADGTLSSADDWTAIAATFLPPPDPRRPQVYAQALNRASIF